MSNPSPNLQHCVYQHYITRHAHHNQTTQLAPNTHLAELNSSSPSWNIGSLRYWSKKALRLNSLSNWLTVWPNSCAIDVWFAIIKPDT
jgi:hypothetical protein